MSKKAPANPTEILELFVVRARRVVEHSLAQDRRQLLDWSQGQMTIRQINGVPTTAWLDLPDEESLDSLAARCRPFVLAKDPVHHGRVARALEALIPADGFDDVREGALMLEKNWQKLDQASPDILGFKQSLGGTEGAFGPSVTAKDLAYAWMYGDLVHLDLRVLAKVGEHDFDARFGAGCVLITNLAVMAISTLNLVTEAARRDAFALRQEVFTQSVKARGSREVQIAAMVEAPVGTPMEDLVTVMDQARIPRPTSD